VTACPSGVQYDKLIEDTRSQVERNVQRAPLDSLHRKLLFALFPHPGRMRALAPVIALQYALGIGGVMRRSRLRRSLPRLAALVRLAPHAPLRETWRRLPRRTAAVGQTRGTVGLLQGCVQRVFFTAVNEATVEVLAAEGWEVHAPRLPRCCGALQLHSGDDEPARELARKTIAAFERFDLIAVNAAGCGAALKDYAHLLRDDPEWSDRAAEFVTRVRDVSELLTEHEPRAVRHPVSIRVAYHDACHLAHAQGVRSQPRDMLRSIPGVEIVEPDEWELCCGSAGVYNLLQPEPAAELGRRKAQNLLESGAEVIVAANPGCALQIAAATAQLGHEVTILHPIELLHRSLAQSDRQL